MRHCCQDTPKRAVHAERGAVSINTEVKSEDTEITDTRNHRHRAHGCFDALAFGSLKGVFVREDALVWRLALFIFIFLFS